MSESGTHTESGGAQETRNAPRLFACVLLVASVVASVAFARAEDGFPASSIDPSLLALLRVAPAHAIGGGSLQEMDGRDYSRFSHRTPTHAGMDCAACHHRADNAPVPKLSGHKDCTSCHLAQFVTPNIPMCAICHTNLEAQKPPIKDFPPIASFNVVFDHVQHSQGAARPAGNCAACHMPLRRGIALSVPAGFTGNPGGHTQCYTCHTPGSTANNRNIASCATCHKPSDSYRRTPRTARAFQVSFSHAEHGARQNLSCNDCHSLRPGLPQAKQVSQPIAQQHSLSVRAQSCMSCHNGRHAFGDRDFASCKRCHTGKTFRMNS